MVDSKIDQKKSNFTYYNKGPPVSANTKIAAWLFQKSTRIAPGVAEQCRTLGVTCWLLVGHEGMEEETEAAIPKP